MAAASNNQYWGNTTSLSKSNVTYGNHLRDMAVDDLVARAAIVLTSAGVGAAIGAGVGAGAGLGIGAGPGAGIGAGVGAGIGMIAITAFDVFEYNKYKKTLTNETRETLENIVNEKQGCSPDDICPITGCVPEVPVYILGEPQIYEMKALKKWLKEKGTSPMTRQPFKQKDIKFSTTRIAKTGKLCDAVLNDAELRASLSPEVVKGLAILRNESVEMCHKNFESKSSELIKEVKNRKISPMDFAAEALELAMTLDPVIGGEATANRFPINPKDIKIPKQKIVEEEPQPQPEKV